MRSWARLRRHQDRAPKSRAGIPPRGFVDGCRFWFRREIPIQSTASAKVSLWGTGATGRQALASVHVGLDHPTDLLYWTLQLPHRRTRGLGGHIYRAALLMAENLTVRAAKAF
jgi:hypothetical protein